MIATSVAVTGATAQVARVAEAGHAVRTGPGGAGAPSVERIEVTAYRVPTDAPESDGTLAWDATTLVLVTARAAGRAGLGIGYADPATARLAHDTLAPLVEGGDALSPPMHRAAMLRAVRNLGRAGIAAMAVSVIDNALWDLKARLLELPLDALFGRVRDGVPVYGSGGFTSYDTTRLQRQLADWVGTGIGAVKMKVGRDPATDVARVRAARAAIGDAALFVDANGAYDRKQAMAMAERFAEVGVTWFEEPVSSDDVTGLRMLRDRAPAGLEISAGEYGYHFDHFRRLLEAGAVDVLQADATRCTGLSGLQAVSALCEAHHLPMSTHCAPAQHVHACCALGVVRHLEYFHDHARIERMLFDGVPALRAGALCPDPSRPGNGLALREADARHYAI